MDASETSHRIRRSRRDRVVDTCAVLIALLSVVPATVEFVRAAAPPDPALFTLDLATGVLGSAALWLRRRRPVELAVVLVAASTYSELVGCAMVGALFTVAVHRPPRTTIAVFALSLLATLGFAVLRPSPEVPLLVALMLGLTVRGAAVGWGLFVRHRRQLVLSQREREVQAEAERRLRAEQDRLRAREEIAREMHDVLGHRLSLLSVHAGALEFNADATPEEIAGAAKVIRESAHQALQDLREVIGVLRAPVGELPQPTLADVRELVAESARAGMRVELREETTGPVPDGTGRTAYRIVQEALTNARKHAPGTAVRVRVSGTRERGLTVEVRNSAAEPGPGPAAGSGRGLPGLAERVALAGGRLEHGPTDAGGWRLAAWLPWPA